MTELEATQWRLTEALRLVDAYRDLSEAQTAVISFALSNQLETVQGIRARRGMANCHRLVFALDTIKFSRASGEAASEPAETITFNRGAFNRWWNQVSVGGTIHAIPAPPEIASAPLSTAASEPAAGVSDAPEPALPPVAEAFTCHINGPSCPVCADGAPGGFATALRQAQTPNPFLTSGSPRSAAMHHDWTTDDGGDAA